MKPEIRQEHVETLFDSRFIKVLDLQYAPGKHYYDATRRPAEDIMAVKSTEDCKKALPDAVSCVVILCDKDEHGNIAGEPKLLLTHEFRYPAGQFLLSPPAGLIDPEDCLAPAPLLITAAREIREETGLVAEDGDRLFVVNPFLFSTPGMTDESNAIVCAVLYNKDLSALSSTGAVGSECFDGFELVDEPAAREILETGTDANGIYYSVYTWVVLMYFISGLWRESN